MKLTDDDIRYIEYLQGQLLQDDWEPIFDAQKWKSWTADNVDRIRILAEHTLGSNPESLTEYLEFYSSFEPRTKYEVPATKPIFEPILEEVQKAASEIGIKLTRPVVLFSSTDISATPAARPTSTEHLLFAGPGTYAFCNYWGKSLTAVTMALAPSIGFKRIETQDDLDAAFRMDPRGLILAARLALHYAAFGTLIGFGEVQQPAIYTAYRIQLVDAMETFAIAHEYAHFVAEENLVEFSGALEPARNQALELFCDQLGIAIGRECGNATDNYLKFAGIGALVSFRAIQLCESVRQFLFASIPELMKDKKLGGSSGSHPSPEERIENIKLYLYNHTAPDQRQELEQFVEEYDRILSRISAIVTMAVASVQAPGNSHGP